jgi:hypothetical protein
MHRGGSEPEFADLSVSKEVVGTRGPQRARFFGGGILRRLLPRASQAKLIFALLRF